MFHDSEQPTPGTSRHMVWLRLLFISIVAANHAQFPREKFLESPLQAWLGEFPILLHTRVSSELRLVPRTCHVHEHAFPRPCVHVCGCQVHNHPRHRLSLSLSHSFSLEFMCKFVYTYVCCFLQIRLRRTTHAFLAFFPMSIQYLRLRLHLSIFFAPLSTQDALTNKLIVARTNKLLEAHTNKFLKRG